MIGETWPSMFVTRQGARMSNGWELDRVREAAEQAAGPLADHVLPNARKLIDEHHDAGRVVVMATTTPVDLVRPLADRSGSTTSSPPGTAADDDRLDGTIDGLFVWGKGKAQAVAQWASAHDIDLDRSYAYSDSYYDVPLLSIVGYPFAVNPDPRLIGIAALRRWPVLHFDVPEGIPKILGIEPQKALMLMAQPQLFPWVRFELDGVDKLPGRGRRSSSPTIGRTSTRSPSGSCSPGTVDRSASSARRRSSTFRSPERSPRPSAVSGSIGAPDPTPRSRRPRRRSPWARW